MRASSQSSSFNFQTSPVFLCSSSIIHLFSTAAPLYPSVFLLLSLHSFPSFPLQSPLLFFLTLPLVIQLLSHVSHHVHNILFQQLFSLPSTFIPAHASPPPSSFSLLGHSSSSSSSMTSWFTLSPLVSELALCMNNGGDTTHFPLYFCALYFSELPSIVCPSHLATTVLHRFI